MRREVGLPPDLPHLYGGRRHQKVVAVAAVLTCELLSRSLVRRLALGRDNQPTLPANDGSLDRIGEQPPAASKLD
jgi:hypothetical protein